VQPERQVRPANLRLRPCPPAVRRSTTRQGLRSPVSRFGYGARALTDAGLHRVTIGGARSRDNDSGQLAPTQGRVAVICSGRERRGRGPRRLSVVVTSSRQNWSTATTTRQGRLATPGNAALLIVPAGATPGNSRWGVKEGREAARVSSTLNRNITAAVVVRPHQRSSGPKPREAPSSTSKLASCFSAGVWRRISGRGKRNSDRAGNSGDRGEHQGQCCKRKRVF
jgi:hypothetical protein